MVARAVSQEVYNVQIPGTGKLSLSKAVEMEQTTNKAEMLKSLSHKVRHNKESPTDPQQTETETVQDMMETLGQVEVSVRPGDVMCRHQLEPTKRSCQVCFQCQVSVRCQVCFQCQVTAPPAQSTISFYLQICKETFKLRCSF